MSIKYNRNGYKSYRRNHDGKTPHTSYKWGNDAELHVSYKHRLWKHEWKNLKPLSKYKVLVPVTDNTTVGGDGSMEKTFYDITKFCYPRSDSKKYNNRRFILDPYDDLRTDKRIWGFDHFLSDDEGRLDLKIFSYAMFRFGIRRITDWNRTWLQDWREDRKHGVILVPYDEVVAGTTEEDPVTLKSSTQTNNNIEIPLIICDFNTSVDPLTKQQFTGDYIQTFYLDPNAVKGSKTVDLTSIRVYFRTKPERDNNRSGIKSPSVTCAILNMKDDVPNIKEQYNSSITTVPYTSVIASSDASVPTTFFFSDPVRLETGKKYAFALAVSDELFIPWTCKSGDRSLGTNVSSPGPTKEHRGELYTINNLDVNLNNSNFDKISTKIDNTDLKFDIDVAEYNVGTDLTINVTNKNEEFLTINNLVGEFFATEYVYVSEANATGTVAINGGEQKLIGTGTTFTSINEDEKIVLIDSSNAEIVEVVTVDTVISDTELLLEERAVNDINGNFIRTVVAEVENYFPGNRKLVLTESTANSTHYITTSDSLIGVDSGATSDISSIDNIPISVFSTDIDMQVPSTYNVSGIHNFAYATGSSPAYAMSTANNALNFFEPNHIRNYQALILSRSAEIVELSGVKSANIQITFDYQGPESATEFASPSLNVDQITFSTSGWVINNDVTDEHTNYGNAISKHISKPLNFREGGAAEDIRIIYNAWRPIGTDIKCYAKIINSSDSGDFDSKSWTLLELKRGAAQFGSKNNPADYREYEFGFPSYPPTESTISGTITTTDNNASITGVGTTFDADISVNDVIKIYNPLFPETNYGIFSVATVASNTSITLTDLVTNDNIVGSGLKIDKLSTPYTAFNNADNLNIVRYFDENGTPYDTYSTVIIKTVLTSESAEIVPKVTDYRVIGVSA